MYRQASRGSRERHSSTKTTSSSAHESSPKTAHLDMDEDTNMVVKDVEDCGQASSSSTSSTTRRKDARRDSADSRRSDDASCDTKKARLDDDVTPRLRLNTSLATDPALRPATVAALTIKPENVSPPNQTPPLPLGLQNGKKITKAKKSFSKNFITEKQMEQKLFFHFILFYFYSDCIWSSLRVANGREGDDNSGTYKTSAVNLSSLWN